MTNAAGTRFAEQFARAQTLWQQGQIASARQVYRQILDVEPDHVGALNAMGILAGQSGDLEQAVQYLERVIAVEPGNSAAHYNCGLTLKALHRLERALACFDRAIALDPQLVPALYERGVALQQCSRLDDAVASYDRTLRIKPDHFEAHANRALALFALGRPAEALASCDEAIRLQANHASLYLLRGDLLRALDRREAALASYERAISLKPDYAEAHCNRGAVLLLQQRIDQALPSLERAIAIKPDYAEAYFHRGYSLRMLNRFDSAAADYKTVATLEPDFRFLPGTWLEANMHVCEWDEFDALVGQIAAGAENDAHVSHPMICMALMDSARLQHRVARTWVKYACPANGSLGAIPRRARPQRLKVGYFSADFHEHPISRLLAELIEIHDRSRFEIVAFSFGPRTHDEWQQRLVRAFDEFIEVREKSDLDIASFARHMNVDIAVDLSGYSSGNRAGIFALRAAPVQVSYLGYLGTMGASYIDYIVADRTVVTPASESHFTEKVIYLPGSHQVNDRKRRMAEEAFTREQLGLPSTAFVFCCFNTTYKISPATFAGWMRILKAVPASVLLLSAGHEMAETNLRAHATRHGVDPRRLFFGERLPPEKYLARYRAADLFLDTLPYNAGTTASDALWAGLPVLTLMGNSFAGRIAASLLMALGIAELITSTQQQYEELAIELSLNPTRLAQIRTKVQENRLTSSLFDTAQFARNLETAYTTIHDRYQTGLPPDHIKL
jgi:predicted O-linked N-acetylglucosamine transferase (SPINDLY family)